MTTVLKLEKLLKRFLLVVFLIECLLFKTSLQYEKKSKCLNEKSNILSITCPTNKITRILKAFYGYSWSGDCYYIEKDCTVDVPTEDLNCLGDGCQVKIIDSPIILQECWSLMASYIQVDYECIPVDQLQSMCSVQESDYSVGYIITPEYPNLLPSELSCPCTLQAPESYTLTIEVLDFRLPSCSHAGLTIWSDTGTYTHCMAISSGILPGSGSQNVSMRLHTQYRKNNAGFLLKYYTNPPTDKAKIKFVCYGPVQSWSLTQQNQNNKEHKAPQTSIAIESSSSSSKEHSRSNLTKSNSNKESFKKATEKAMKSTIGLTTHKAITDKSNSNINNKSQEDEAEASSHDSKLQRGKKSRDWTALIISIIASVIFLLILINALIWFIFSIKKDNGKGSKYKNNPDAYLTDLYKLGYNNDDETTANSAKMMTGIELDPAYYKKNLLTLSSENFFGGNHLPNGSSNTMYSANPYLINKVAAVAAQNHHQHLLNQQANMSNKTISKDCIALEPTIPTTGTTTTDQTFLEDQTDQATIIDQELVYNMAAAATGSNTQKRRTKEVIKVQHHHQKQQTSSKQQQNNTKKSSKHNNGGYNQSESAVELAAASGEEEIIDDEDEQMMRESIAPIDTNYYPVMVNNNNNNNNQSQQSPSINNEFYSQSKSDVYNSIDRQPQQLLSKKPPLSARGGKFEYYLENPAMILYSNANHNSDNYTRNTRPKPGVSGGEQEVKQHKFEPSKYQRQNRKDSYNQSFRGGDVTNQTIDFISASQVPIYLDNSNYMYEEQEGNFDLQSEYSFKVPNYHETIANAVSPSAAFILQHHPGHQYYSNNNGNKNRMY